MSLASGPPVLRLPSRFEALQREVAKTGGDLNRIVYRVDSAAQRIETLLRHVRDAKIGRFELMLGASGSGKTTFLSTLPFFFRDVVVDDIPPSAPLREIANFVRDKGLPTNKARIFVMNGRDNPVVSNEEARQFFESLRVLFREENGDVAVIWPITDSETAKVLGDIAWQIGRDSIVDVNGGTYQFEGLSKQNFYNVADTTTRSLNGGQSLETFGLTPSNTEEAVKDSQTIGEFYTRLEGISSFINKRFGDVLKEKKLPSVWILIAADDNRELDLTVSKLTQGTGQRVDIDRLVQYLDDAENPAQYLKEWRKRRSEAAYLMRRFDVRLFPLSPNVALSAVRAYGEPAVLTPLNNKVGSAKTAIEALSKTLFFGALSAEGPKATTTLRATTEEAAAEYVRLQEFAVVRKADKLLNKALAEAIQASLQSVGIEAIATAEKQSIEGTNLRPDVRIDLPSGQMICLEPTWRTTGRLNDQQNTAAVGHIQQYLLNKVIEYINAFLA
ncbi:MAG TPA: hypothetical protein VM241_01040 [Candidatus Thermoplasmatota archaeon]|nr:hypothetical protein [Candidatus Thermoplasmatota archaeon]